MLKPKSNRILESKLVFNAHPIKIREDLLELSPSDTYSYYTLETPPYAVVIIASTQENLFIINEEYRYPLKKYIYSLPGGFINENESPEQGAERELLEETGYSAESFEVLGKAYPYAGISTQLTYYVRANHIRKKQEPILDPTEKIVNHLMPLNLLEDLILKESIDANLCTAIYLNNLYKHIH